MDIKSLTKLVGECGLTSADVYTYSHKTISHNQASQWLHADKRGKNLSRPTIALLWAYCERKQGTKPVENQSVAPKQPKTLPVRENNEVEATPSKRKIELSPGRFRIEGEKVWFAGKYGVLCADYQENAEYFVMLDGFRHNLSFDTSKNAGNFEIS